MTTDLSAGVEAARRDLVRVFPGLDTVRAVGALMVMTTHVAFWTGSYDFDVWGTFLSRLDSGVALFFVLSGFLLSRPFILRARIGAPRPALGGYLRKRGLRVLPVYWLVAVLAMVYIVDNEGAGPGAWLTVLTLTDIYVSDAVPAGITQTWSLATEVAFYILLPGIMLMWNRVTGGRRSDAAVVALTLVAAGVSLLWITATPTSVLETAPMSQQWLPTFAIWFGVGIALGHVHVHHVEEPSADAEQGRSLLGWVPALGRQPGVCMVIAGACLLAASTPIAGPPVLFAPTELQLVTKTALYAVVGALVVLAAACAEPRGLFARVMAHPVSRHLGHISYGVFCVHVLVLHLISTVLGWEQFTGGFLRYLVVTLLVSLVLAELVYRVIERPSSRLRRGPAKDAAATRANGSISAS